MCEISDARILIVDDEPSNILVLRAVLEHAGYTHVEAVTDSRRVQQAVAAFDPDLILLDLRMEHLDGIDVLNLLMESTPADVFRPIIVLTADAQKRTREASLDAGAIDYLAKPFDIPEIVLRVRNVLRTRMLYLELKRRNTELETIVGERTRDLEAAHLDTLDQLAMLAECRDDETYAHTKRVGDLAALIAEEMNVTDREVRMLRFAARLHDLGKAGIPDSMLLKPGAFTEEERQLMAAHTTIGGRILGRNRSSLMQLAEEIALTHHERWAGKGYPLGLSGQQIPLSGRIVAVADVFDALTHDRPYKKAWTKEKAIKEIKRLSGEQFDPEVVEAFLKVQEPSPPLPNATTWGEGLLSSATEHPAEADASPRAVTLDTPAVLQR